MSIKYFDKDELRSFLLDIERYNDEICNNYIVLYHSDDGLIRVTRDNLKTHKPILNEVFSFGGDKITIPKYSYFLCRIVELRIAEGFNTIIIVSTNRKFCINYEVSKTDEFNMDVLENYIQLLAYLHMCKTRIYEKDENVKIFF